MDYCRYVRKRARQIATNYLPEFALTSKEVERYIADKTQRFNSGVVRFTP